MAERQSGQLVTEPQAPSNWNIWEREAKPAKYPAQLQICVTSDWQKNDNAIRQCDNLLPRQSLKAIRTAELN